MTRTMTQELTVNLKDLEPIIKKAMNKVGAQKETDLCKYIPGDGGYIHHWTLQRMKLNRPQQLIKILKEHIIDHNAPKAIPPKPRAKSQNRTKGGITFNQKQLKRLMTVLETSGEDELLELVRPKLSFKEVQRQLIQLIREGKRIEGALLNLYLEGCKAQSVDKS